MPVTVQEVIKNLQAADLPVDHKPGEHGVATLCLLCPGETIWTEDLQRFVCSKPECPGRDNPSLHADALYFRSTSAEGFAVESQGGVVGLVEGGGKTSAPLGRRGFATLRRCDIAGMLATEPEPIDWLAHGVVARGYLSLLVGREKTGKSLMALAISARCAGGGGTVAGIECANAKVLYLDCENGSREIHRRVRALGLTTPDNLVVYEGVGFNVATGLEELDQILTHTRPDLVWLDSWRSMWSGDENSAQEASQVLDPLRELIRRHNVGAGLLHHANKLGQYRGSTAVGASVESIVEFSKADEDEDRRRRRLRNAACRFEQEADDRWVRIEADRTRGLLLIDEAEPYVPSHGGRPRERDGLGDELLAALNGTFTAWSDWARAAGLDPKDRTARRARDELAERGLVTQAQGLWLRADTNGDVA